MKKTVVILIAFTLSNLMMISMLSAQDFKKEFEWFDLKVENGEAYIHPKKNLYWSTKTQEERKLNSYFMSPLGCRDIDSFEVDQNGNITHYFKISQTGTLDSSIIASSENTEPYSYSDWKRSYLSENELLFRASQLYIKKLNEFLIISIPTKCSNVSKYKYTENYDNNLYSKINWENPEYTDHASGYLLVYNLKTKKVILDLPGHSLYNLNADGITYSNYQTEDSKKLYSMMNWSGNYSFKNINLKQLSDNDTFLKSIIGNCKAIYDKNIRFPYYPDGFFVDYGFRYITHDGKCGFFNFSGQHEKYDVEFTDGTPLFIRANRLNYYGRNINFYKKGMIIHPADTSFESIYDDALFSWVNDTIITPADTVNGEFQNMDTLLKATHCLAYLPDLERRGYNSIIQDHFTINGEQDQFPVKNYLAPYNFIWKKGSRIYSNSAASFHVEPLIHIVKPDPNDPTTWYDSINPITGALVYDTAMLLKGGITEFDGRLVVYDIKNKSIIEKKGQSISAINEDGILMQEIKFKFNLNAALGYLNDGDISRAFKKYWTIDTNNFKNRKSFRAKDIITNPNDFLKSFLGSGNFTINYIHHSMDIWTTDTLFTIEYTYKNKRRVISNSQALIEIAKTEKLIPIGDAMYCTNMTIKEKLEEISKQSKPIDEIKFQVTEGNASNTINSTCIFHNNAFIFSNPGTTESINKVIMPDPIDPATWYNEIDENGNMIAEDYYITPGYLTLTSRNLDVIYSNKKSGITGFNDNLFLLQEIEIIRQYDTPVISKNYSIMEINANTGYPIINEVSTLEGFIGRNDLESLFFPASHLFNSEGRINKSSELIEISKNHQIVDGVNINKPAKIDGNLKNSVLPALKKGKYGLIRMDGQIVAPFLFDGLELIEYDLKNHLLLTSNDQTEIYDMNGRLVAKFKAFKYFIKEQETPNEFGKTTNLFVKTPEGNYLFENFSGKNKIKLKEDFFTFKLDSIQEDGQFVYTLTNGIQQEKFYDVQKVTKTKKGWFIQGKYYDQPLYDYFSEEGYRMGSATEFRFTGQPEQKNKLISKEFIIAKKWYNMDYDYTEDLWQLYHENGNLITENSYTEIIEIEDSILALKGYDNFTLLNPYTGKKTENPIYIGYSSPIETILDPKTGKLKDVFCFMDDNTDKFGIMDNRLNIVKEPIYFDGMAMDNDLFWMSHNEESILLDKAGRPVFPAKHNALRIYDYGDKKYCTDRFIIRTENNSTVYGPGMKKWLQCEPITSHYWDSKSGIFMLKLRDSVILINETGKIISRKNYKSVNRFKDGYAVFSIGNPEAEGVINNKGIEVIPAKTGRAILESYSLSNLEPIVSNGVFIYKINNRFGLIDASNKEVTGPDFEKIDPINPDYFIVTAGKDKLGLLDRQGKSIIPLENRSISGSDSLGNRILSKTIEVTENGIKKNIEINALLDQKMNILLTFDEKPEIHPYSNKCDCYPVILQNGSDSKATFYFPNSNKLETDLSKFHDQNFVKEFSNDLKTDYAPEWKEIPGMTSTSVTAFHEDSEGNWWIGAGPRQGVYLSKDEGKNWIEVKEGLGDVHISLIGTYEGRIYAEENLKTIYELNSNLEWSPVTDSFSRVVRDTLASITAINQLNLNTEYNLTWHPMDLYEFENKMQDYKLYESMLNSYIFADYLNISYYDHFLSENYSNDILWLDTSNYYGGNEFASNLNPMPLLRSGNFFKTKNSKLLMIGNNGLCELDNLGNRKARLNPAFEGSYVISLVKKDNKTVLAVTSDEKIWKLNDGKWQLQYDAANDASQIKPNDPDQVSKISHVQFTKDGLLFTRNGNLYFLDKTGKSSPMINSASIEENAKLPEKYILSGIKKGKAIYGVARLLEYPTSECIYKYENNKFTTLFEFTSNSSNVQVLTDPKENIWIFDREKLVRLKNDSTGCDTLYIYSRHDVNFFKNKQGKFQLVDEFNLNTYDPSTRKWHQEQLYNVFESGYIPIHSFTMDTEGNGFLATGIPYAIHYREEKANYYNIGLSKIYFDGTKYNIKLFQNAPNNWITSICPYKDGLLVGTIGSGVYFMKYKR